MILYPSTYPTLPYPTNHKKILLPASSIYPTYPIHPNKHFPILYYCQGIIKYKAETTYQIRPKRPRTETTQAETTQAELLRAEMTRDQNDPRMQLRL